jgi:AcrR family transcriptional regulator
MNRRMTTAQERKQQERQARRRRIQRAARTVFAERGYAKTSIEQIAREASLSVGAIYLYFRSKEDLYVSLLEETLELFDSELRQIRSAPDLNANEQLRAAWAFLTQWARNDVEATRVLRLISQPNIRKQLSDEVASTIHRGVSQVRDHLASIVHDGVNAGMYRGENADQSVDLLWSLLLGVLQANDARINLDLAGGSLDDLSQTALSAVEASLRSGAQGAQATA